MMRAWALDTEVRKAIISEAQQYLPPQNKQDLMMFVNSVMHSLTIFKIFVEQLLSE